MAQSQITPLLVTHYSPKPSYGDLAPPSSRIVKHTVESIYSDFGSSGDLLSEPLLIYNHPTDQPSTGGRQYEKNLATFADDAGVELMTLPNDGLRSAMLHGLDQIDTEYVLFMEHDWVFKDKIEGQVLLQVLEENPEINYIRFNKRENRPYGYGWDTIVEEDNSYSLPLCRVSSFSNTPHLARMDPYVEWIKNSNPDLQHFYWAFRRRENDYNHGVLYRILKDLLINRKTQVKKYNDVEYVVDTMIKHKIRKLGFEKAHSRFGTYLYGKKGEGPYVEHLGV